MGNILFGIIFVIGGLSGKLVLIGTGSSTALVVVGALMIGWGGFQMVRSRGEEEE